MEIQKESLKGNIDIIILSLLHQQDMYGYQLAKQVREQSRGQFELKEGTMYPAFKRLEKNGYIVFYWGEEDSGGGRRKYFHITDEGKDFYEEKRKEWIFLSRIMNYFIKGD